MRFLEVFTVLAFAAAATTAGVLVVNSLPGLHRRLSIHSM
jgi:hypothetical protein